MIKCLISYVSINSFLNLQSHELVCYVVFFRSVLSFSTFILRSRFLYLEFLSACLMVKRVKLFMIFVLFVLHPASLCFLWRIWKVANGFDVCWCCASKCNAVKKNSLSPTAGIFPNSKESENVI